MLLTRLKTLGAALVAILLFLGASAWAYQVVIAKEPEGQPPVAASTEASSVTQKTLVATRERAKTDQEQIQGKWRLFKVERMGLTWVVKENGDLVCEDQTPRAFPIALEVPWRVTFSRTKITEEYLEARVLVETATFRLDPSKKPKWITNCLKDAKDVDGIYAFEQDTLRICWNYVYGKQRAGHPAGFDTTKNEKDGMDTEVWFLKREKK